MRKVGVVFLSLFMIFAGKMRVRDYGIKIGIFEPGTYNAITDVSGVLVGHKTIIEGDDVRTGVTVIIPHSGNLYEEKVPAAIYVGNGYGKIVGYTQVRELGELETPIVLTNTLSVWDAAKALVIYTMKRNPEARSINPVVGETNDGYLNDIRKLRVKVEDVLEALEKAKSGPVEEGNVGAGTGTIAFGFKGGIGTASRKLPEELGGYTVGVLVQTNFGGVLNVAGVPVGKILKKYMFSRFLEKGSCMIVVATDAPLTSRNLYRLAKRALFGLARTGGAGSNGSGDYVIAFSTAYRIKEGEPLTHLEVLPNSKMTPLFMAVAEATEEAILNSLFAAETMKGFKGRVVEALPVEKVIELIKGFHGNLQN